MNKANRTAGRATTALGIALVTATALTGCLGWVGGGGGDYGVDVGVPGPDFYLFGGGYDRGRDVHGYSHRGGESRAAAHPAARGGGGGEHGGRR